MMSFKAFHSEYAQGCMYYLVVYLKKPAAPLAFSSTMLGRIQPSANNANIIIDPNTLGKKVTMAAGQEFCVRLNPGDQVGGGSGHAIPPPGRD
jgi:hypothetical protein